MKDLTITAHRADHVEKRQRIARAQVREFANVKAQIIYHQAEPDAEPHHNGFVCRFCRHTFELCTCKEVTL